MPLEPVFHQPFIICEKPTQEMEIVAFEPDHEKIVERRSIRPFGDVSKIKTVKSTAAPPFNLYTAEVDVGGEEESKPYVPYRPTLEIPAKAEAYVPPEFKRPEVCSVKLSNLPLDMTRERLYTVIKSHSKLFFTNLNLVMNRETGVFRGFAFVTLESKDDAMQFIRELRGIAIDNLGLAVELARP